MPTVLVHPWATAGGAREETWAALEPIRRWGPVAVVDAPCILPQDYGHALAAVWGRGWDVLVVEQDVVVDLDQVHRLMTCRGPVCAQAYPLHPSTTRLPESVWSPKAWQGHAYSWVPSGTEWADTFGLGCTLIRQELQQLVPAHEWQDQPWWMLDTVISDLAHRRQLPAHVHWPSIRHLHGEPLEVAR